MVSEMLRNSVHSTSHTKYANENLNFDNQKCFILFEINWKVVNHITWGN